MKSPNQPETEPEVDAFASAEALTRLRRNAFETVGAPYVEGILYGIGLTQGLVDGLRVARGFTGGSAATSPWAGGALGMLFRPGRVRGALCFEGALADSLEAAAHLADLGASDTAVCHVSAGYSAGWYSAALGEFLLVRECRCAATHEGGACRFELRSAAAWLTSGDTWAATLLAYVDFDAMKARAEEKLTAEDGQTEGDMMGAFDPLSPAVHIWGPVMVLPYSGAADSIAALDTIQSDLGRDSIRVVVLDVSGARIDGVEAIGLLRLIDVLDTRRIETVLSGLAPGVADEWLTAGRSAALPLRAQDISEGIALAFQLSSFS